jgi:polysaccharide pyruvyl transferase WcaK-like protein
MVKRVYITGYYKKDNTGDDIFEKLAHRLFVSGKSVEFVISSIDELKKGYEKTPKIFDCVDSIVLFGGETLNDYFLKTLSLIKTYNQSIKMYAIGVGLGADVDYLKYYLPMFNYIIVRHHYDYEKIKSRFSNIMCIYVQDICFMYQIKGYKQKMIGKNPHINHNTIGLFLSQPKYHALNKNKDAQEVLLKSYMSIVNNYIKHGYSVKLFSMCYNNIESESDTILNNLILQNINPKDKGSVTLVSNKAFEPNLLTLKYAVCERFHSHILCLIYNIPFISLANTIKVNHLLHDLGLENTMLTSSLGPKEIVRGSKTGPELEESIGSLGSSSSSNGSGLSSFSLYSIYNFEYDAVHEKLLEIEKHKSKLKDVYKKTYPDVEAFYNQLLNQNVRNDLNNLLLNQHICDNKDIEIFARCKTPIYIANTQAILYCNRILNDINHPRNIKDLADYVLMKLFGTSKLDYKWGIEDKIRNQKFDLDQIKWLFDKSLMEHQYLFNYFTNQFIQNFKNKGGERGLFNIDYIDQYDRTGVHRHGWKYVIDHFSSKLCSYNPHSIKCDMYVDRTFHWARRDMVDAGIIPYRSPWIGIIHHTMYKDASGYNSVELLKCPEFIASLKHCKGLVVLSNYLKLKLNKLASHNKINLPHITVIHHPGYFVNEGKLWRFGAWKLGSWKGEVIQIGSWMRDLKAIFDLKYKNKFALIGKDIQDKYKSISFGDNPVNFDDFNDAIIKKEDSDKSNLYSVKILKYADNETYDEILSRYVVFIKLYDSSAVNTVIECITRNTPIVINRLPAVEEYLGSNYPLFYDNIDEVPQMLNNHMIVRANTYLKNMNKDFIRIENFIKEMEKLYESIIVSKD